MIKADLKQTAAFENMERLSDVAIQSFHEGVVRSSFQPGSDSITTADSLIDRKGYNPNFLSGWSLPLPLATAENESDMLPLKRGGTGVELKYHNFSVVMSALRRMPLLTAVNLNGEKFARFPRINTWSYDGRIDKEDQWGDELYGNNILDRGHMVRREDPVWGPNAKQANADTFHFTNCCPQIAGVNQKTWLELEDYILNNARLNGLFVNVYTGPYFSEDDLEYRGAKIPLSFWKVVAVVTENGRPSATAYEVSQERELSKLGFVYSQYKTYQVSIQKVMDQTGIDFCPMLDYDGFSQQEKVTGKMIKRKLENLGEIMI